MGLAGAARPADVVGVGGANAHLLVGSLAHSGKWRGTLAPFEAQPHLVDALGRTTRALGGLTRAWRFDRMTTVCNPGTGRVSASFAGVAKYYWMAVKICPARRTLPQGGSSRRPTTPPLSAGGAPWPRTPPSRPPRPGWTSSAASAPTSGCAPRRPARSRSHLLSPPNGWPRPRRCPYPALLEVARTVSAQALVAWRGNSYSVVG